MKFKKFYNKTVTGWYDEDPNQREDYNFIKLVIRNDETDYLDISWDRQISPEHYGKLLTALKRGFMNSMIDNAMMTYAESTDDIGHLEKIWDASLKFDKEIDMLRKENENADNVKNKIIAWEHIENNLSDIDEPTDEDDDEEDGSTKLAFIPGAGIVSRDKIKQIKNNMPDFELRLAFTNFRIPEETYKKVSESPGVGFLTVIDNYTFIIRLGKLFSFTEVRQNIEKTLGVKQNGSKNSRRKRLPKGG